MSLHDDYLMECPTMLPQKWCSRCGRTGIIEMHHVVPRSRGGHRGPVVALCERCHHHHHSVSPYSWDYHDGAWWADDKRLIEDTA